MYAKRIAYRHLEHTKDVRAIEKIEEIIANPDRVFIAKGAYSRYSMSDYLAEHILSTITSN